MDSDWTAQADFEEGTYCCNTSDRFRHVTSVIEQIIRESASTLVNSGVRKVAGLIAAQLAHKHGVVVSNGPCPCGEEKEIESDLAVYADHDEDEDDGE